MQLSLVKLYYLKKTYKSLKLAKKANISLKFSISVRCGIEEIILKPSPCGMTKCMNNRKKKKSNKK